MPSFRFGNYSTWGQDRLDLLEAQIGRTMADDGLTGSDGDVVHGSGYLFSYKGSHRVNLFSPFCFLPISISPDISLIALAQ